MTYRYKVIRESNSDYLQADLDNAWGKWVEAGFHGLGLR
jgi:hypothetical protein